MKCCKLHGEFCVEEEACCGRCPKLLEASEPLTTERLLILLRRPWYVYNMTTAASAIPAHRADTARSRSLVTRRRNAKLRIENLLRRWEDPDD